MSRSWQRRSGWLALLIGLTLITRLPALVHPRAFNDERIYSLVAIEILEGGRPYVDAVERKPPLLFWTYAAILGAFGRFNVAALHAVGVLWVLLTMAGLYAVARMHFDRAAGVWAALLYCIYQPWLFYANLAFNGEVLMNLPVVWALYFTMRRNSPRRARDLIAAGVLLCAGFLLKQPAVISAVPLGLYLLLPGYRASGDLRWRDSLAQVSWLAAGFLGALACAGAVLQAQGILAAAYYWTIADHDVPLVAWKRGLAMSAAFAGLSFPMLYAAAISMGDLGRGGRRFWREREPELVALTMLAGASMVGVASSGRFYQHYFIQLIPPMALLAAPVLGRISTGVSIESRLLSRPFVATWLTTSLLVSFVSHWIGLAERREISDAGSYILAHSTTDDRIFVWGQSEGIYLDARRRPASRYITTYRLTGQIYGWPEDVPVRNTTSRILPGSWEILERELTRRQPRFIVDAEVVRPQHLRYPMNDYPVIQRLVDRQYRVVFRGTAGWVYERTPSR